MKTLAWMGMTLLLLVGCGESNAPGAAFSGDSLCDEVCGWPDACFEALGAPLGGADCMEACEASVDAVGAACLGAIADTVNCLGTCDVESITESQALACQDEAERISSSCD